MNYNKINNDDLNIKAHLDASLDRISMSEDLISKTLKAIRLQAPEAADNSNNTADMGNKGNKADTQKGIALRNRYIYGFARAAAVVLIVAAGYTMLRSFGMKKNSSKLDIDWDMAATGTSQSAAPEFTAAYDNGVAPEEEKAYMGAGDDLDMTFTDKADESSKISRTENEMNIVNSLTITKDAGSDAALSVGDIFISEPEQIQSLTITDENADSITLTKREDIKGLYTVLDRYQYTAATTLDDEDENKSFIIVALQEDESKYTMTVGSSIVIDYITEETAGQGQYELTNIELMIDDLKTFCANYKD
jgi:hypothetical protein